jgi:hypothetical protein
MIDCRSSDQIYRRARSRVEICTSIAVSAFACLCACASVWRGLVWCVWCLYMCVGTVFKVFSFEQSFGVSVGTTFFTFLPLSPLGVLVTFTTTSAYSASRYLDEGSPAAARAASALALLKFALFAFRVDRTTTHFVGT